MTTLNARNMYYSTLGRHLKHELSGVEFKLSDKFKPVFTQFQELNKMVNKREYGIDKKYYYNFELEQSVLNDFETHEINKLILSGR